MNLFKNLLLSTLFVGLMIALNNTKVVSAAARDCDDNAVVYCGVLTKTELEKAYRSGTGKKYQSGTELNSLFSKF